MLRYSRTYPLVNGRYVRTETPVQPADLTQAQCDQLMEQGVRRVLGVARARARIARIRDENGGAS